MEKLETLGRHLKSFLSISINGWLDGIEGSEQKEITVDLADDFEPILMRNTTKNVFGEDISTTKIDYEYLEKDGSVRKDDISIGKSIFSNVNGITN